MQVSAARNGAKWRKIRREGDGLCVPLTRDCQRGDRVRFDPGPGLRVTGTLKEWTEEGMAAIEVDQDDVGIPQQKLKHPPGAWGVEFPEIKRTMIVPVKE